MKDYIQIGIEKGIISNVSFEGGCNGNLKGISALAEGKHATEVIDVLTGITCGFKSTSCPDQFAKALKSAMEEK
jgi:uncharacterized protein (TIGR03905 family)